MENVQLFLKRAASKLDIPADIYEYIEKCHSVVRFDIPLQMDDGKSKSVDEMQMVNKKTGKDVTKHLLDYMEGKIDKATFEKLTGLKK